MAAAGTRDAEFPGQWHPQPTSPYGAMPQSSPGWSHDVHGRSAHNAFPLHGLTMPVRAMSYSGEGMPGYQPEGFSTPSQGMLYDQRGSNFQTIYNPVPSMEPEAGQVMTSPDPGIAVWSQAPVQSPHQAAFQRPDNYETAGWPYDGAPNQP